jgi:hypothetical protein
MRLIRRANPENRTVGRVGGLLRRPADEGATKDEALGYVARLDRLLDDPASPGEPDLAKPPTKRKRRR